VVGLLLCVGAGSRYQFIAVSANYRPVSAAGALTQQQVWDSVYVGCHLQLKTGGFRSSACMPLLAADSVFGLGRRC